MDQKKAIRRTDAQLAGLLDESGTWIIHGTGDQILGAAATLRRALDRASEYARSGAVVVAVARVPPNRVFVFQDQIIRLSKMARERVTA